MAPALLLLVAAVAHLLAEPIAIGLGHKVYAWETVLYGIEAMSLWLFVASVACWIRPKPSRWALWAVAGYGVFESSQRSVCRVLHPMDRPLRLPDGVYACDAAGLNTSILSPLAVALVAVVIAATSHRGGHL